MMDQDQFLGHPNYNGKSVSMLELQRQQQDLWSNTFAAAVRAGKDSYGAASLADSAVKGFNARFVPDLSSFPTRPDISRFAG